MDRDIKSFALASAGAAVVSVQLSYALIDREIELERLLKSQVEVQYRCGGR